MRSLNAVLKGLFRHIKGSNTVAAVTDVSKAGLYAVHYMPCIGPHGAMATVCCGSPSLHDNRGCNLNAHGSQQASNQYQLPRVSVTACSDRPGMLNQQTCPNHETTIAATLTTRCHKFYGDVTATSKLLAAGTGREAKAGSEAAGRRAASWAVKAAKEEAVGDAGEVKGIARETAARAGWGN